MLVDRGERGAAAVLSPRAAELFGLEVLAADIQSEPRNRTRFLVIAPAGTTIAPDPGAAMHSTLLVAVRNEPGTLVRVLEVLAAHGLNMTKLESRPSRSSTWEYVFWIDVDADMSAPAQASALTELEAAAVSVRVLGCYAKAPEPI
jgi:chorismate mutase/prephenate dehydratase